MIRIYLEKPNSGIDQLILNVQITTPSNPASKAPFTSNLNQVYFIVQNPAKSSVLFTELVSAALIDTLTRMPFGVEAWLTTCENTIKITDVFAEVKKLPTCQKQVDLDQIFENTVNQIMIDPAQGKSKIIIFRPSGEHETNPTSRTFSKLAAKATEYLIETNQIEVQLDPKNQEMRNSSRGGLSPEQIQLIDAINDHIPELRKKTIANLQIEFKLDTDLPPIVRSTNNFIRQTSTQGNKAVASTWDIPGEDSRTISFEIDLPENITASALEVHFEYEDLVLGRKVTGGQRFELE